MEALSLPDPHPIDLTVSDQERYGQFFATLGLETLRPADLEEQQRQQRIEEILAQKRARAAAASSVTDAQLRDVAQIVIDMTEFAIMMVRTDIAIAAINPDDKARLQQSANDILRQVNRLLLLKKLRPVALTLHPRLATWWTDGVDRRMQIVCEFSVRIAAAVQVGDVARRSPEETQREMLRILPGAFGSSQLTPENVVEFCMREGIVFDVCRAVQLAKESFPGAHHARLELDNDPEGTEEWVWLRIDVPDDQPLDRFEAFLRAVQKQISTDSANKFELAYNVV